MLSGYLRRVRGTVADAEQILVCSGFGQGVNLVLGALARDGIRRVAIEDPGDDDYEVIAGRLGVEAVPVAVDELGIDVDALAASDVRAVILTPTRDSDRHGIAPEQGGARPLGDRATRRSSRTTTTPSFATTAIRSGRLEGLIPSHVALIGTTGRVARSRRCGSGGSPAPRGCSSH